MDSTKDTALIDTLKEILTAELQMRKEHMSKPEGFIRHCLGEVVLEFGREYSYQKYKGKMMTPKMCFSNAAQLAMENNLIYVEGFALIPGTPVPIHHAWCVKPGSNIAIDTTALHLRAYFGIPFSRKTLMDHWRNESDSASLLDDWKSGFTYLRLPSEIIRERLAK